MTYHDYYDLRRSVRTETHKLLMNFSSEPAFIGPQSWRPRSDMVMPPHHAMPFRPRFELYDLENDPPEQRDVAADGSNATVLTDRKSPPPAAYAIDSPPDSGGRCNRAFSPG